MTMTRILKIMYEGDGDEKDNDDDDGCQIVNDLPWFV